MSTLMTRLAAGDAERQIGALRADAGEGAQHLVVAGQLAAELLDRARAMAWICRALRSWNVDGRMSASICSGRERDDVCRRAARSRRGGC